MLEWHLSNTDFSVLHHGAQTLGSDTSPVNLFLLCDLFHTEVAVHDGILFRYYQGNADNCRGYGAPLSACDFDSAKVLSLLKRDAAQRGASLSFCAFDERQMRVFDGLCNIRWSSRDGDGDYIYKRESLALLSGKKLHAKKNLVNRFWRLYPDASYQPITKENIADALIVAEQWFAEREEEGVDADMSELAHIRKAAEHWEELGLFGGVLYAEGVPAAMTMASAISKQVIDVHFEKAVGSFAAEGAYAAVNQAFAASDAAAPYVYVNREEDMGIPGLRKVKEAYRPAFKVEKYFGIVGE